MVLAFCPEEMVEAHLEEGGGRRVGGNVAPDTVFLAVGSDHHGHGVPPDDALDSALDLAAARKGGLLVQWNRVDVGRVRREVRLHPVAVRPHVQVPEQVADALRPLFLVHVVQGVDPLPVLHIPQTGELCIIFFRFHFSLTVRSFDIQSIADSNKRSHPRESRNGSHSVETGRGGISPQGRTNQFNSM